ncbi:MAG: hypothetical protein Q9162_002476 [Coniocarpon cinnabarinum]
MSDEADLEAIRARLLSQLEAAKDQMNSSHNASTTLESTESPPNHGSPLPAAEDGESRKRKRDGVPTSALNDFLLPVPSAPPQDNAENDRRDPPPLTPNQLADLERQFAKGQPNRNGDMVYFKRSFLEDPWARLRD